ncbi:hypothetical protein V1514DRAFT_327988 [Lipomyces japonicus]|uniref:uncharacterized protein n=1 Tax=Lipomyces japonicus TaxID=56871 RepID=UPI0034CF5492
MAVIPITIRHAGKKYQVDVDLDEPGEVLKYQLFSLTGVDPDRQKILVKGGQLTNDANLNLLGLKPNQSLMMMGTVGDLPKEPVSKTTFVEDLTDRQLAQTLKTPIGITNLGNTCYLNSTLQGLRLIPELYDELDRYQPNQFSAGRPDLAKSLRDLYRDMRSQTSAYYPFSFLQTLRAVFPQFAEQAEGRYKQQDAEEAWSQILSVVNLALSGQTNSADPAGANTSSFADKFIAGSYATEMKAPGLPDEPVVQGQDRFLKLDCHISLDTNHLSDGLKSSLTETIEKRAATTNADTQFTLSKKISRLPKYLTVHFVRFYWRRDTGKKSKILRKVTFPFELDVTDLCTDELKTKLVVVRDKVRELRKAKEEKIRAVKRARTVLDNDASSSSSAATLSSVPDDAQIAALEAEALAAVDPALRADVGANVSGLYELVGVVSHQGKSADSGHYQFWAKQTAKEAEDNAAGGNIKSGSGPVLGTTQQKQEPKWWRFNDDKVTVVDQSKIEAMAGGGESDSALLLLYKSVDI